MPLCVLDFYIDESLQRKGYGKRLFEFMMTREQILYPSRYAYDRPSPKLLSFLSKHYGLKEFSPQANNFVIFDAFFEKKNPESRGIAQWERYDTKSIVNDTDTRGTVVSSNNHSPSATLTAPTQEQQQETREHLYPPQEEEEEEEEVTHMDSITTKTDQSAVGHLDLWQQRARHEYRLLKNLYENKPRPF